MSALPQQVRARAQDEAAALRGEAAELLAQALPGVAVEIESEAIRLTGRGLARRWASVRADHLLRSHLR